MRSIIFPPDQQGYILGIQCKTITLKKRAHTIKTHELANPLLEKETEFSFFFCHGGIELFAESKRIFKWIDPQPIFPKAPNNYCGLGFLGEAVFRDYSVSSRSSEQRHLALDHSHDHIRLGPKIFSKELYRIELISGNFLERPVTLVHLKDISEQFQLQQQKEQAEQEARSLQEENLRLKGLGKIQGIIVGNSDSVKKIKAQIPHIAASPINTLILGKTGTGKDLVAQQIHGLSGRKGPFVKVDCAAIPDSLLESELFGHERGAFTGAHQMRIGHIERANHGTLFLDEIGNLTPSAQAKLLRVLQDRKFERIGGRKTLSVDIRIVSATNTDLKLMMKQGGFREDLFFRLNGVSIMMPDLDQRKEDIPLLVDFYFGRTDKSRRWKITKEALSLLQARNWPGNVRELFNVLDAARVMAKTGTLGREHLPDEPKAHQTVPDEFLMPADAKPVDSKTLTLAKSLTGSIPEFLSAFLNRSITTLKKQGFQIENTKRSLPVAACRGFNSRQFRLLGFISRKTPISIQEIKPLFSVTGMTLGRDINLFKKRGLVTQKGAKRGARFHWAYLG